MPLQNIYSVTQTLTRFLEKAFEDSPAWEGEPQIQVSPLPPTELKGDDALGLYLYHLSEDPHRKNVPPPGSEAVPVRYTPMGLSLHYQLTPHSDREGEVKIQREQLIMSVAVKALRDWPVIDGNTAVSGNNALHAEDRIRIVLEPIPHTDAVSFWTAGTSALRLAAYYQVSVVLLEPEVSRTRAGRVLSFGVYGFPKGIPHLDSSENVVTFTPDPDGGAAAAREVTIRPAQVPFGERVAFKGSDLGGDAIDVVLNGARWDAPGVLADAAWGLRESSDGISVVVRPRVSLRGEGGAPSRDEIVAPGVYSAAVRVARSRIISDGSVRRFEQTSNEVPFTVTPRMDGPGVFTPAAGAAAVVQGYGFPFDASHRVQVYLGEALLTTAAAGAPGPGEYRFVSTYDADSPLPDDPQTLEVRPPPGLPPGSLQPLRVVVNGAESPPRWIRQP